MFNLPLFVLLAILPVDTLPENAGYPSVYLGDTLVATNNCTLSYEESLVALIATSANPSSGSEFARSDRKPDYGILSTFAPDDISMALSVRSPNDTSQPFDFEVSTSATWVDFGINLAGERENGKRYFNYEMVGGNELIGDWYVEYSTQRKDAAGINRQGLRVLRREAFLTYGGGLVSSRYRKPIEGVFEMRVVTKQKFLALTTNFDNIHIWEMSVRHEIDYGKLRPFVRGVLISDNGDQYYKLKFGIYWKL